MALSKASDPNVPGRHCDYYCIPIHPHNLHEYLILRRSMSAGLNAEKRASEAAIEAASERRV
jgi:hypothetical protein